MASNPPAHCCITSFQHEGVPQGQIEKIDNIRAYFAQPNSHDGTSAKSSDTAILFVTDILGMNFVNAQVQADKFAQSLNRTVVMPDLFDGDAVPAEAFLQGDFDLPSWLKGHGTESVDSIVEKTIKYLREDKGFKKIGAVGYCFGAKYVVRFLQSGRNQHVDVGYIAHPSFVTHDELAAIQGPLSISAAEIDAAFTRQLRYESEEILAKIGKPWQITVFSGVSHGFAVRIKLDNRPQYWAKEQAYAQAVAWFVEYLN